MCILDTCIKYAVIEFQQIKHENTTHCVKTDGKYLTGCDCIVELLPCLRRRLGNYHLLGSSQLNEIVKWSG